MQSVYYAYLHRFGAYIGHTATFGSEPCLPHSFHGIFIAGNARIGKNCVIFQQVTIGANALPDSKGVGSPTIGNGVYIGTGAKIVGNVSIGDNCRIGANCVVTRDIPDNSIVVMTQPDVITRERALDNRYYRWSPDGPVYFELGHWVLTQDPDVIEKLKGAF